NSLHLISVGTPMRMMSSAFRTASLEVKPATKSGMIAGVLSSEEVDYCNKIAQGPSRTPENERDWARCAGSGDSRGASRRWPPKPGRARRAYPTVTHGNRPAHSYAGGKGRHSGLSSPHRPAGSWTHYDRHRADRAQESERRPAQGFRGGGRVGAVRRLLSPDVGRGRLPRHRDGARPLR